MHKANPKVGNNFFADFETGTTSIDANTVAFDNPSEIPLLQVMTLRLLMEQVLTQEICYYQEIKYPNLGNP